MTVALATWLTITFAPAAAGDVTLTLRPGPESIESYTGRVYLVASQGRREPRYGDWWFNPEPLFHVDVAHWTVGEPLVLTADTRGYPIKRLGDLPAGDWSLQSVIRTSDRSAAALSGAGTVLSRPVRITGRPVAGVPDVDIVLDTVEPPRTVIPRGMGLEQFDVPSELLSEHFGRPFLLRAVVQIPERADAAHPVPTLYVIGGFPGSLSSAVMIPWLFSSHSEANELAIVYLEAEYRGGHSAFVDSPAGGPWGTSLVTELIPTLEAAFPLDTRRDARFVTGHSSGGWSALWLALEHREIFGGTVSTAPDPVDFTRFQTVDIYASDANIYRSHDGQRAPLARRGGETIAWADDFIAMESAMGEGGQMRSFEWTFSPRGPDGLPVPLWNRDTGVIDPDVATHWRQFDIADRITREWDALQPVLKDRVLVVMGTEDTFHLDGAALALDAVLTTRGLPDIVELVPGDHSNILTLEMTKRIMQRALSMARRASPPASDESTTHTPSPS